MLIPLFAVLARSERWAGASQPPGTCKLEQCLMFFSLKLHHLSLLSLPPRRNTNIFHFSRFMFSSHCSQYVSSRMMLRRSSISDSANNTMSSAYINALIFVHHMGDSLGWRFREEARRLFHRLPITWKLSIRKFNEAYFSSTLNLNWKPE